MRKRRGWRKKKGGGGGEKNYKNNYKIINFGRIETNDTISLSFTFQYQFV